MADALKVFRGTAGTTEATVYTAPEGKALILQGFWVSNSNTDGQGITIKLSDKRFVSGHMVPAKDTLLHNNLQIPLVAGDTIKITGAVADDLDYSLWGLEVDV